MVSPLLQALLVLLLVGATIQIVRMTGWRGRLALFAFVLVCVLTNPERARHVRAIERAAPEADVRLVRELVEYHDFFVLSAGSIQGRLVSLGWLDRLFVGSLSCATRSRIAVKSPPAAPKSHCKS